MEKNTNTEDAGLFQVRRVYYKLVAAGSTPTARAVYAEVGGNYNTTVTLVREVNREHLVAQTIIGGLPEATQSSILAQIASLLEPREAAIRSMYASEQQMLEEAIEHLRMVEARNESLAAELARSRKDHETEERDLSIRLSAAADTVSLLQRRCTELDNDKERLIREVEKANSGASVAKAELGRTDDRVKSLERQLVEKDVALMELSQKLTEAEKGAATAASNFAEVERLRREVAAISSKLDGTREALAETKEQLFQKSVELIATEAKFAGIRPVAASRKGKLNCQHPDAASEGAGA